jgi:HEAT repeat protein
MSEKPYRNLPKLIQRLAVKWIGLPALAISAGGLILLFWLWSHHLQKTNFEERTQSAPPPGAVQQFFQSTKESPLALSKVDPQPQPLPNISSDNTGGSIVAIIARIAGKHIEQRLSSEVDLDTTPLNSVIQRFLNSNTPLKARRADAWRIAKAGTPEAMAALNQALNDAPSSLKAAIGEALGYCDHPDAKKMMLSLLESNDEVAARGAIRGLAATDDSEAIEVISQVLLDSARPESLRIQTAVVLGEIDTPTAYKALINSFSRIEEPDADGIAGAILEGLGKLPFTKTEAFFSSLLSSQNATSELRVAAIEALANSSEDAASLLFEYTKADLDPEVRAAAAWAISTLSESGNISSELVDLVQTEKDPNVRRRLFEAISNQTDVPVERLLPIAMAEQNPAARLAAFELVADVLNRSPQPMLATQFDRSVVQELLTIALQEGDFQSQLRSIITLKKAKTPDAVNALETIGKSSDPRIAEAARSALNYIRRSQGRTTK